MRDVTIKKDVQRIVILLTSAIATGCLIAGIFLYGYSPTGRYIAGKAILDPHVMDQINLNDSQKKKGDGKFVFVKTDFSYFDSANHMMQTISIPFDTYSHFYNLIESQKSIEKGSADVKGLFNKGHLSTIITTMREKGDSHSKEFQVIEFVPGDYYRVQLHGDKSQEEWAYFYEPGIYNEINTLFIPTTHTPRSS